MVCQHKVVFVVVVGLGLVAPVAACSSQTGAVLEPAPAAKRVGPYKAVDNVAGVYIETTVDDWPGDPSVLRNATPLHVLLRNDGDSAVAIAYPQFELAGPAGRHYAALPPVALEKRAGKPAVVAVSNLLLDPLFLARGYQVHPMYGALYDDQLPELETNRYRLGYSIDYHETKWAYWRNRDVLPTEEMRSYAIPPGVLEPGGEMEGYLFFEKVDEDDGPVTFRARLIDAETGGTIGDARIPFETRPRGN